MDELGTLVAMDAASIAWRVALAFFLVIVAVGLVYLLIRAGRAVGSVERLIVDVDREATPIITKAQTTVDEVNAELGKVNDITQNLADMTQRVEGTTRLVEESLSTPAKKAAAFSAGVSQSMSSFFSKASAAFHSDGRQQRPESSPAPTPNAEEVAEAWAAAAAATAAETPPAAEQAAPPAGEEPKAGSQVASGAQTAIYDPDQETRQ